jgi:precorrin-2 methylase
MSAGKLIGVGVGPGDPELITLKAIRALAEADVVAHFAKADRAAEIPNDWPTRCPATIRGTSAIKLCGR